MSRATSIVLLLRGVLLPAGAFAKGEGVGLRMEGTISNLEIQGDKQVQAEPFFAVTGRHAAALRPDADLR